MAQNVRAHLSPPSPLTEARFFLHVVLRVSFYLLCTIYNMESTPTVTAKETPMNVYTEFMLAFQNAKLHSDTLVYMDEDAMRERDNIIRILEGRYHEHEYHDTEDADDDDKRTATSASPTTTTITATTTTPAKTTTC